MNNLNNIDNTFNSFQKIIDFYLQNLDTEFSRINILIQTWFAANLSAVLGAILDKLQENLNIISFEHIDPKIKEILQKNGFLDYYGYTSLYDNNSTTVSYKKLEPTDNLYFIDYIQNTLLNRSELPSLSSKLRDKITESISELFENAQQHSNTKNIYVCGQFYPKSNNLAFTIVDTGIGIKNKINERFGSSLTSTQAIKWAIQDKNTTKDMTGGLGLPILKEFIVANKGYMQIISSDGFYELSHGREEFKQFNGEFPGTIINLSFKTDDNNSYSLYVEINPNEIF